MEALASWIEQLSQPKRYPGGPEDVEIIQTHISVVCIAGDDVYKLKKPVKLPFLDFSTPDLREHFCQEEVRLNQRLCPQIYRGVVPLYKTGEGVSFVHGPSAKIVDHAVLMARLPHDRMLDELLAKDAVSESEIRGLARHMVAFHHRADRSTSTVLAGAPNGLHRLAANNFEELAELRENLFMPQLHDVLRDRNRQDFEEKLPLMEQRAREGFVMDGHGDLHARNICLTNPPAVYDCIEFNDSFRCEDVATEHAFLVMDLRYRRHRALATAYLDEVISHSGDEQMRELIPMLVRYRAMVRAKVAAFTSSEEECGPQARQSAAVSAQRYMNLAAITAVEDGQPMVYLSCGLPGTGKTYVCEELARQSGWTYVASDHVRKELADVPLDTEALASAYTEAFSARTYEEMIARADRALALGPVIVDANYRSRDLRQRAINSARALGARVCVLWFQAPEAVILERLSQREAGRDSASDATTSVYELLKATFEEPTDEEGAKLIKVNGAQSSDESIAHILCHAIG
ncbi:MAG: AAA family ATPase [Verrucomicrobiaceae bacterium]|nr:AAA family ATPase [Verrucomicrobiaceae bacterium]